MIGNMAIDDDLSRNLQKLGTPLQKRILIDALKEAGEPMRARMAANAPRSDKAPHIYQNVVMSSVRSLEGVKMHEDEAAIAIGPDSRLAAHGVLQEFGTVHHAPQAFARPAWDAEHQGALSRLGGLLWTAVRAQMGGSSRSTSGRGI